MLLLLVAIASLGDLVTTSYGISIGLPEQNPFVANIIEDYGFIGMVILKLVAIAWVGIIYTLMNEAYGKAALFGLFVPQSIAVLLNLYTIAQA